METSDLPSITIYTASQERKDTPSVDLEFDVAKLGMHLLDFSGKNRRIWLHLDRVITKHLRDGLQILIRCQHGKHRSVETAEYLKYTLLRDKAHVTVQHLETKNKERERGEEVCVIASQEGITNVGQ